MMQQRANSTSFLRTMSLAVRKHLPEVYYFMMYYRGMRRLGNRAEEADRLFAQLVEDNRENRCLQIGVKDNHGQKFGPNWTSVDLYDTRDFIDYNYDIHDLRFDDESFDVVTCISILEHVADPPLAITEMTRVLKPGGAIWIQLPWHFPYHADPHDYWRASPSGVRAWMRDYTEHACGSFLFTRTALVASTFFYGSKKPG